MGYSTGLATGMAINSNHGGYLSAEGIGILIGIFIVLNLLWIVSWIWGLIRWLITRNDSWSYNRWDNSPTELLNILFDGIMATTWALVILVKLGEFVYKLIY